MARESRNPGSSPDPRLFVIVVFQIAVGFGAVALLTSAPGVEMSTTTLIMRIGAVALIAVALAVEAAWFVFDEVRHVFGFSVPKLAATSFVVALLLILLS